MALRSAKLATKALPVATSQQRREQLARRVRWLVTATISYNVVEAAIALAAGAAASSIALIGFGLDSGSR